MELILIIVVVLLFGGGGSLGSASRPLVKLTMIDFRSHSRSCDVTRHAVRFWGFDSAIEASFLHR